jgi:DNA-binding XRE family transcriptional regulator
MLISTEAHYQRSLKMLQATEKGLIEDQAKMEKEGRTKEQIKRVLDPTRAFLKGMAYDLKWFERAKKGEIPAEENFETIGRTLIALRIGKGLTQEALAQKLGVSQSMVSQDENDEYHGISVERAQKILAAFGLEGKISFAPAPQSEAA